MDVRLMRSPSNGQFAAPGETPSTARSTPRPHCLVTTSRDELPSGTTSGLAHGPSGRLASRTQCQRPVVALRASTKTRRPAEATGTGSAVRGAGTRPVIGAPDIEDLADPVQPRYSQAGDWGRTPTDVYGTLTCDDGLLRTSPNGPMLTTDQEVAGSNPAERTEMCSSAAGTARLCDVAAASGQPPYSHGDDQRDENRAQGCVPRRGSRAPTCRYALLEHLVCISA